MTMITVSIIFLNTYAKTDLSAPKALYAEWKNKKLQGSLSADSNGTVVIDKNVTDLLSVSIEHIMILNNHYKRLIKAKVVALSNSFY